MKHTTFVPQINTNDDEVELVAWHVSDGAAVEKGVVLADVETTKAVQSLDAEHAGFVRLLGRPGDMLPVGAPLVHYFTDEAEARAFVPPATATPPPVSIATSAPAATSVSPLVKPVVVESQPAVFDFVRFTPAATRLLAELGVPAARFAGAGLVNSRLVRAALAKTAPSLPAAESVASATPADAPENVKRFERISGGKRHEIAALRQGSEGVLHSSLTVRFDSADLRSPDRFDGQLLPLILREVAGLLMEHPRFTSCYYEGQVAFYDRVDLGVALDLGLGLKVVTLRSAHELEPEAIHEQLIGFSVDYLQKSLKADALAGSTFTVTDLSGFEVLQFEPIINGAQSAILGIGGDSEAPGHPVTLTLAFDHRVHNGREAALFLRELRARILAHRQTSEVPALASGPAAACCDRCFIDLPSYHATYGSSALMLAFARADGSQGLICHVCQRLR